MDEIDMQGYESFTEYLDDLTDTCEMRNCLEETFGVDSETSKKALVDWAKEIIQRYG